MRFYAGCAYASEGRDDAAAKQFDAAEASPDSSDDSRAVIWVVRAGFAKEKGTALAYCEKATKAGRRIGNDCAEMCALFCRLRWAETDKERIEIFERYRDLAKRAQDPRFGSLGLVPFTHEWSPVPAQEKKAMLHTAYEGLKKQPVTDPTQRLADLALIVSGAIDADPEYSVEVATETEAFAKQHFPASSEEVQLARLIRAKTLNKVGREKDPAEYGDVFKPGEDVVVGFNFEGDWEVGERPKPVFSSYVRKKHAKDD